MCALINVQIPGYPWPPSCKGLVIGLMVMSCAVPQRLKLAQHDHPLFLSNYKRVVRVFVGMLESL